jgi:hypothetical protein
MFLAACSFLCSCYVLNYSYAILLDHLDANTPNFDRLEEYKKYYVIKNLMKAVYLCVLSFCGLPFLLMSFRNYFPNTPIKILASLYCSNDCVGLYKVKKLPTSTRLHHIVTTMFLLVTYAADFQEQRLAQMLFYYTFFSACAFPVNAYLGLRHCYEEEDLETYREVSKYTYAACCFINWIIQFYFIGSTYYDAAYALLLAFIIYDDVYLLRWLWKPRLRSV